MKKVALLPPLIFLLLSAGLIFCWFRFGYMYGGGDTGLPTYSPQVAVNIAKNIWWDSLAPGIPVAQGLTSVPLMLFLSIPQALGASPVFIQAFLFFILLFLIGYGMYLLALYIFGKDKILLAYAAGIFYVFNPYMMIQIWHRFIHNSMVFVAFLPFLVLTWLWWIRKRDPKFLLLFLLANFLAVYVYGTIAFIVAVWTLLFSITLLEVLVPWKGKETTLKIFFAFLMGLLFWLLTNSWWLIPTFSISPALFATQHTIDDSLTNLVALSIQTVLPFTLRLINPFYLYWHADWGSIYQNIFLVAVSWLFAVIVFIGFLRGFKEKAYAFWSLLFLIVVFLAKGAAAPFNFPYIYGFSHFFPLGVIRNPFEKLGILLPLVFAILFALGLHFLFITSSKYIGRYKTYLLLVVFIGLHLAFFHPMFTGKLFGSLDRPAFVEVPKSYTEANEWIKQDIKVTAGMSEGRILHLPLPRSEDVKYNWPKGYNGVEPSAAIFTSLPSIARGLDLPMVSASLSALSLIFHAPYTGNPNKILELLQAFNIKFIILHKDIEWRGGNLYDPAETEGILNKLTFLDKRVEFGDLRIYRVKDEYYKHKIIITDNIGVVLPGKSSFIWPWLLGKENNFISPIGDLLDDSTLSNSNQTIILPRTFLLSDESTNSASLDPGNENSPISQLEKSRSILSQYGEIQAEEMVGKIISANQTMIEIINAFNNNQKEMNKDLIKAYGKKVAEIFRKDIHTSRIFIFINESTISSIFKQHLSILEQIKTFLSTKEIDDIATSLRESLVSNDLISRYSVSDLKSSSLLRQIFKFKIPERAHYQILMTNSQIQNKYSDNLTELNFQINHQQFLLAGKKEANFIAFGEVELNPGEYEISYFIPSGLNLVSLPNALNASGDVKQQDESIINLSTSGQKETFLDANLGNVSGGDIYQISFETKMLKGSGFYLQLEQDTDTLDLSGRKEFRINQFIPQNSSNDWQSFNFTLPPLNSMSQKATIRFALADISAMSIRNLKIERFLNNSLILMSENKNNINSRSDETLPDFSKQTSSSYKGNFKLIKPAFFLFNETYHPGWKLKLKSSDGTVVTPDKHILANLYGNAWFVDKAGDYTFDLEFEPQKSVYKGFIIAGISFIILLIVIFIKDFKSRKH